MLENAKKFFLAANSCEGFVSEFDADFKGGSGFAYIIKGGPGTGKSSFLKYIAARAYDMGATVTLCPCSSDPDSLDGVIIEEINTVILDGTAPHTVEPHYPGVSEEIINLGEFWDGSMLKENAEEIRNLTDENSAVHKTASAYLRAAGEFKKDSYNTALAALDGKKCDRFSEKICNRYFKAHNRFGKEKVRFLSGVTPKGVVTFKNTLEEHYENLLIIDDKYGAAGSRIINYIKKYALINGYDVESFKSAFLPSSICDHIVIKELSLCILTEHDFCCFGIERRRIHSRRFYDVSAINRNKMRFSFNKRVFKELVNSASRELLKAKKCHDRLENFYIDAMDFPSVVEYAQSFFDAEIAPLIADK